MKEDNNRLDQKEGYIHRFISWCKKKIKAIVTIGSIGLIISGIQLYLSLSSPNLGGEMEKTIVAVINEYDVLKPEYIPEPLMSNEEVKLLREYQTEFEIFKRYLSSLDYSKITSTNGSDILDVYMQRYMNHLAFEEESKKLESIIKRIINYEKINIPNSSFISTININTLDEIELSRKSARNETQEAFNEITIYRGKNFDKLNNRQKKKLFNSLDKGYANDKLLQTITLTSKFYKEFYVATGIRIKEIVRDYEHGQS